MDWRLRQESFSARGLIEFLYLSMLSNLLVSFREFHQLSLNELAVLLSIPEKEYRDLEVGLINVNCELAQKLSQLYLVPASIFQSVNIEPQVSITYSHCHFENGHGYVNHLNGSDISTLEKDATITALKEEIKWFRDEHVRLINLLVKSR